jgi:hypothetical protein
MDKKRTLLFLILGISIAAIFASAAYAANGQQQGALEALLKSFGGRDLGALYNDYSAFIDMIIYLILFIGLTEWTLKNKLGYGNKGRTVTAGLGIILAVGLALYEQQAGFNLMSFGPIAMAIVIALMAIAFYEGLKEFGVSKVKAICFAYIGAYAGLAATGVIDRLLSFSSAGSASIGFLAAIAMLIFYICLVVLGISTFLSVKGWFPGGTGGGDLPAPPSGGGDEEVPPEDAKKAEKDISKEEKLDAQEIAEIKKSAQLMEAATLRMADDSENLKTRGTVAASTMKELRKRHFPRLNKFNKRAEKVAVRLLNEMKAGGKTLDAEDEVAINNFEKMRKDIIDMEALFSDNDLLGRLRKNPSNDDIQKAYNKFDAAYKDLKDMMILAEKVYAIDKKLEKQVERK